MKRIRIYGICDTSENTSGIRIIKKELGLNSQKYRIEWDSKNPDYLFVTTCIYKSKEKMAEFLNYYSSKRVSIFLADEAVLPDLNLFDYALTFNDDVMEDRICKHPTYLFFAESIYKEENELKNLEEAQGILKRKTKFCNFIYSNAKAHPYRDELFWKIGKYKKVDSLGQHLNNTNIGSSRFANNWREISIKLKGNYKFSIAAENASFLGYTSEKILTTFQAHSIPIYWGNANIEKEFNPKAFINCSNFETIDDVVEEIRRIDQDEKVWLQMVMEPWRTEEQREREERNIEKYKQFVEHIFSQDLEKAKRAPQGTMIDIYYESLRNGIQRNEGIHKILSIFNVKEEMLCIKNILRKLWNMMITSCMEK